MMKRLPVVLLTIVLVGGLALGEASKFPVSRVAAPPMIAQESPLHKQDGSLPVPVADWLTLPPTVGTYTTLGGYYDYQNNGGASQYIRVDPSNGAIHVIMMVADDSSSTGTSRGTAYAYSTDGGVTWNNFNQVRVPARLSGFPTMDLLQGPNQGLPAIANHSTITGTQSGVFVDSPPGTGAFSELNAPQLIGGGFEPIWPYIAGASDGSIVIHSSPNTAPEQNYLNRTADFSTWQGWTQYPGSNDRGGRYPTMANAAGRVGSLLNGTYDLGVFFLESTNNGVTWPTSATQIYPVTRIVGTDTLGAWVGADFTYDGNNPLIAINTSRKSTTGLYFAGSRIEFWSQATGFVDAVPWDSTKYPSTMVTQSNHLSLGYPAIAKSGSRIVIAFMAFLNDTTTIDTTTGRYFGDVFYVQSGDGGLTWTAPVNLTNTPQLDERYPSISKYNEPGFANIVWQEDKYAGTWVTTSPDAGTPGSRARQVFLKLQLPSLSVGDDDEFVTDFKLRQNFPNPFNPVTKISYTIPVASEVRLSVSNMLGQEVKVVVDSRRNPGTYEVSFSAADLPSGVYFYTLRAGQYTDTKKMILVK